MRHGVLCLMMMMVMAWGSHQGVVADEIALVEADLLAETASVQPGTSLWVALRLRMAEGWHTYWVNPGDAGLPTSIRWTLPEGFVAGPIQWPYPRQVGQPPVASFGFEKEAALLTEITVPESATVGEDVRLRAHAEWLACEDVCVKGEADVSVKLPVSDAVPEVDEERAPVFARARAQVPITLSGWIARALDRGEHVVLELSGTAEAVAEVSGLVFFPSVPGLIEYGAAQQVRRLAGGSGYAIELVKSRASTATEIPAPDGVGTPTHLEGVVVADGGWQGAGSARAISIDVPIEAAQSR